MGRLLLVLQQCCLSSELTMKVQVMSNLTKTSLDSGCRITGTESVPVVHLEDVDGLKCNIKAVARKSQRGVSLKEDGVPSDDDVSNTSKTPSPFQFLKQNEDSLSPCTERVKDLSQDDTDTTISLSSDTTLDLESSDLYMRTEDGKLNSLSSDAEDKRSIHHSTSPLLNHVQSGVEASCIVKVMPSPVFADDLSIDLGSSARFSKVLENISLPLLYIPTTKQLVAGSGDGASPASCSSEAAAMPGDRYISALTVDNSCLGSEGSANSTLDLLSSELLSPHSPMHKANSAQEFFYTGKYAEGDRLTVHSTDSYPGFHSNFEHNSHLFADNSSLSSVSTGTDFSVSAVSISEHDFNVENKSLSYDEAGFVDISLNGRNSFDKGYNSSSLDSGYGDKKAPLFEAARKKSFTGLKNLFTKKAKDESPPGWKLFGRVPPKPGQQRQSHEITSEFQIRQQKIEKPSVIPSSSRKQHGSEVMSTTALILESRPVNLPSKNPEEIQKHRQQYEEMVEAAKKKELREIKLKKKHLQQQRKLEDQMMSAARVWDSEILPNWESMRSAKKTRDLWWLGLPPNVRGRVWHLAVGNDLNITHALYNICHERAEERIRFVEEESGPNGSGCLEVNGSHLEPSNKESSVQVIKLDVSRTFPQLGIFQKGGPFHDLLHNLLGAYACYRPDVGYVQGMSFIAAILLLNMDVADAFVCFANLLNRPCQLAFFRMDENLMTAYYRTFEEFLKDSLPKLHAHFNSQNVTPNLYLMEWVFLIYSRTLPLDVACRVWDIYFRDGEEFLFRTALAILKIHESVLLKMDFIHAAQFLTKLPEDVSADQLFREIDTVRMSIDKRGFHAVYSFFKDLHANSS